MTRMDPDLGAVARTLHVLADGEPVVDGQRHALGEIEQIVADLQTRANVALRGGRVTPRSDLERLLTDASAQGMAIEAERIRTKRQVIVTLADQLEVHDAQLRALRQSYLRITEALDELHCVTARLRAQLEQLPPEA